MEEMWLTRDKVGPLVLSIGDPPLRLHGNKAWWYYDKIKTKTFELGYNLFTEVQWSDDEPTKVKLVIEK